MVRREKLRSAKRGAVFLTAIVLAASAISVDGRKVMAAQNNAGITQDFVTGVDISSILAFEESGQEFYDQKGVQRDIFEILKESGVNYIRVRVWNNPYDTETGKGYGGGNCDLEKAVQIGLRAKEHGMKLLVDFQYSDFWADPAKQYAPKAWIGYSQGEKAQAIHDFTYDSLVTLINAGVEVGMVQIGNETNGSMCGMGGLYDGTWNLTTGVGAAMQKGCEAVNEVNELFGFGEESRIEKVLHFTDPNTTAAWYAEQAEMLQIDYDIFAVSAYPFWHGSPDDLSSSLKEIAKTYNKKVMVAETAYPYTFENSDSTGNNIGSRNDMTYAGYEVSVSGQEQAVKDVFMAVASVNTQEGTQGYGVGGFYWEPAWIGTDEKLTENFGTGFASAVSGNYELLFRDDVKEYVTEDKGSSWDNMAMFDAQGKALESLSVFDEIRSME